MNLAQIASQNVFGNIKFATFGHISSYNPTTNTVQCILPTFRDAARQGTINPFGNYLMTPEIPLSSFWVGNKFGFQWIPHGGSTVTNPTAGEQCLILFIERENGLMASACLFYNDQMLAPYNTFTLQPGEAIFQHESGTRLYFKSNGDVYITGSSGSNIHLQTSSGGQILLNSG